MSELDNWGEEAKTLLKSIAGQHSTKKRRTLLSLADAAYSGTPQTAVFKKPENASKVAHYKWLENDAVYHSAYALLVGNSDAPGTARQKFQEEGEEQETAALLTITKAKRKLRMLSGRAVDELENLLSAEITIMSKDGTPAIILADSNVRLRAANSILDRNPETAGNEKLDHTSGGEKINPVTYITENRPNER